MNILVHVFDFVVSRSVCGSVRGSVCVYVCLTSVDDAIGAHPSVSVVCHSSCSLSFLTLVLLLVFLILPSGSSCGFSFHFSE